MLNKLKYIICGSIFIFFQFTCISIHDNVNNTYKLIKKDLKSNLSESYRQKLNQYPDANIIAFATFPADDLSPGSGNSLYIYRKSENGKLILINKNPFPLKVAAKIYKGRHTGNKKTFLTSPVGIFGMHRGTKNGSRLVSWAPQAARLMANADFVPAIGLKVPYDLKPQPHFHYAIHTVPVNYTLASIKEKAFDSLGCFSLLTKDMRVFFNEVSIYPTKERLFISIYDTISIDNDKREVHIYKDIYSRGVNNIKNFKNEIIKKGIPLYKIKENKINSVFQNLKKQHNIYPLSEFY